MAIGNPFGNIDPRLLDPAFFQGAPEDPNDLLAQQAAPSLDALSAFGGQDSLQAGAFFNPLTGGPGAGSPTPSAQEIAQEVAALNPAPPRPAMAATQEEQAPKKPELTPLQNLLLARVLPQAGAAAGSLLDRIFFGAPKLTRNIS